MVKIFLLFSLLFVVVISGCMMLSSWRSIPPPGGCDKCHTVPISANWQVAYQVAALTDERNPGRPYFQSEQNTMPKGDKPASSLDIRKVEDQRCFDCHRLPSSAHRERKGRYHH